MPATSPCARGAASACIASGDGPVWGGGGDIQHSPNTPTTRLRERGNDTSGSTGRSGRQNAATRRNMRREERVTVQGPLRQQQPDGMSHKAGGACHGRAAAAVAAILPRSTAGGVYRDHSGPHTAHADAAARKGMAALPGPQSVA